MINLEEVKEYLRIDFEDEDKILEDLILEAQIYVDSCVSENYKTNEKAVKLANLLIKKIVSHLYENRSISVDYKIKTDRIVTTILDKLSNY